MKKDWVILLPSEMGLLFGFSGALVKIKTSSTPELEPRERACLMCEAHKWLWRHGGIWSYSLPQNLYVFSPSSQLNSQGAVSLNLFHEPFLPWSSLFSEVDLCKGAVFNCKYVFFSARSLVSFTIYVWSLCSMWRRWWCCCIQLCC